MCTSLVLFVLSGVIAPAVIEEPTWFMDYSQARKVGRSENKPLAVFIGSGIKGWENMSHEGGLNQEVAQLLSSDFVCVYIDTSRNEGMSLAAAFKIIDGPGLVISNRVGELQAFRHEGKLPNDDLERHLRRYATETQDRSSYYYDPSSPGGSSGYWGGGRGC